MFGSLSLKALGLPVDDAPAVLSAAAAVGFTSAHLHLRLADLDREPLLVALAADLSLDDLTWLVPPDILDREASDCLPPADFAALARMSRRLGTRRLVTWSDDPKIPLPEFAARIAEQATQAAVAGLEVVVEPDPAWAPGGWSDWIQQSAETLGRCVRGTKVAFDLDHWRTLQGSLDDLSAQVGLFGDVHLSSRTIAGRGMPQLNDQAVRACWRILRLANYGGPVLVEPGRHQSALRPPWRAREARRIITFLESVN